MYTQSINTMCEPRPPSEASYNSGKLVVGGMAGLTAIGIGGAAAGLQGGAIFINHLSGLILKYASCSHVATFCGSVAQKASSSIAITAVAALALGFAAESVLQGRVNRSSNNEQLDQTIQKHWSVNALMCAAGAVTTAILTANIVSGGSLAMKLKMAAAIGIPAAQLIFKVISMEGRWKPESLPFSGADWSSIYKNDKQAMATALLFGANIGLAITTLMYANLESFTSHWHSPIQNIGVIEHSILSLATAISTVGTMVLLRKSLNDIDNSRI